MRHVSKFLSINRQKVKRTTSLNQLIKENNRDENNAEYYDDGHRMIDVSKTKDNVILVNFEEDILKRDDFFSLVDVVRENDLIDDKLSESMKKKAPRSIDTYRENFVKKVDTLRSERTDLEDTSMLNDEVELRKATQRNNSKRRATRKDAVDIVTSVVQPSASFINSLSREQQIKFFQDCLDVMKNDEDTYGKTLNAVIHFDENTPHLQVISSTYNAKKVAFDGNAMLGNKTKMSNDQTKFVEAVHARGWDVERGIKRINNVEYKNFKDEMKRHNIDVNRHNDKELFESYKQSLRMKEEIEKMKEEVEKEIEEQREQMRLEKQQFEIEQQQNYERLLKESQDAVLERLTELNEKYRKEHDVYRVVARDMLNDRELTTQKINKAMRDVKKENQQDEASQLFQDIAQHQAKMSQRKSTNQRHNQNEFQ